MKNVLFAKKPDQCSTTLSKNKDSRIKLPMWKINKDGACGRCQKDRLRRRKSKTVKPAKFSGIQSIEIDMGPKGDLIRHNNMHFSPVPPYLHNLSMVEKAVIAKILTFICYVMACFQPKDIA